MQVCCLNFGALASQLKQQWDLQKTIESIFPDLDELCMTELCAVFLADWGLYAAHHADQAAFKVLHLVLESMLRLLPTISMHGHFLLSCTASMPIAYVPCTACKN